MSSEPSIIYLPTQFQLPHTLQIFNIFNLSLLSSLDSIKGCGSDKMSKCRHSSQLWWNVKQGALTRLSLIAEEDRPARVLGLLVCLAGNQARDEGLGCSKLDKMAILVLPLALMDDCPELSCFREWGVWGKSTTLVQSEGAGEAVFFSSLMNTASNHKTQTAWQAGCWKCLKT